MRSSACFLLLLLALTVPASFAQLDSSCMVSAFNRTAPVQADGVWVLPNVPANLGPVRVRATCVQDGFVRFGASGLVTVPSNGVIRVEQIDFQGPPPVPSSLSLLAPQAVLTAIGQTARLSAFVTYPGGATADVTAGEKGTDYRSSNPAVVSVDADGLATARASGVVLVSAANEGALGVIRLQVIASGDSDGDGLPDDWEMAHGLDPNDPADALDDPDADGLTTIAEYQGGTDPFVADTDGDGLPDGREAELGTNPLLADTDGDGLRDGLEVRTGSDPLDPNSFNLAAALQSIEVTPGSFRIVYNTVLGEASRQLRVTGRLIDGFPLDLTARRYGTAYGSSDFSVAGFGAEDGRVYAGRDGTATVRVSNSGFSAAAQVTVETFSPRALAFLSIPGFPNGVALSGDRAFVAAGATGLWVVDVEDPENPFVAGSMDTPGNANDVRVEGDFAFVADGSAGLVVVDVSRPGAPRIVGRESTAGPASDLVVTRGRAYVADEQGLSVVDVSDPAHPLFLGAVALPQRARGVDVVDGLAVVAASGAGVYVIDVSDPANLVILGSTATRPDGTSNAADVTLRGRLAYVADGAESAGGGLRVIDFRDPTNPVVSGASTDAFLGLTSTALEGGLALGSDYGNLNAVPIFDADPMKPRLRAILDFFGPPLFRLDKGHGLAVRGGFVYLAAAGASRGLADNGATGVGGLYIGRYANLGDEAGVAPTVSIAAPAMGSRTAERLRLTIRVDAKDDVRVANVRFLVNGRTVFTDFGAPYEYSLAVPAGVSELRIGAVATDDGGNEGVAQEVVVPVDPNTAPVAALLTPQAGQNAVEGSLLPIGVQATDDREVTRVEIYVDGALRKTVTRPPYRLDFAVPLGVGQLTVSAIAYDDAGASPVAGPLTIAVTPDGPPTAAILAPSNGARLVEGSALQVVAGVSDDAGIRRVELFVDGVRAATSNGPSYQWIVFAPAAGEESRLQVVAEDTRSHRTSSPEVVITGIPDPLTGIQGRTVDVSGAPLAGARVEAGGTFTFSNPEGVFSLAGLPTTAGDFSLTASAVVNGFELHGALASSVSPEPGAVVEVGDVTLTRDDPGTTVTGKVADENGAPVGNATVKVYDSSFLATTTSGPDGGFTLAGAPSFGTLSVAAFATVDGVRLRGLASVSPAGESATDAGTLLLSPVEETADPGTTVVGTVTDESGSPVPAAQVHVFTSFDVFPVFTAPDGTFSLSNVPAADGDLFASVSVVVNGIVARGEAFSPPEPGGVTDFGTIVVRVGGGARLLTPPFSTPRSDVRLARRGGPTCGASAGFHLAWGGR